MTKKISPSITFVQMPIKLETEMFFDFLEGDWSKIMTDKYPEFLRIKDIKTKKKKIIEIKKEISKIRIELGERMGKALETIKKDWQKVEEKTFQTLAEIIQEDWSTREIIAYISINPICPRYLDSWSFSVSPNTKSPNIIIAHEVSHFLYFKKFKEIFPEIKEEKYEFPHKEWLLSEIITPTVLNDIRIRKIIGRGAGFYDDHRRLEINGKLVTEIIRELYDKFVIKKKDFSEFIRESLKVINKI